MRSTLDGQIFSHFREIGRTMAGCVGRAGTKSLLLGSPYLITPRKAEAVDGSRFFETPTRKSTKTLIIYFDHLATTHPTQTQRSYQTQYQPSPRQRRSSTLSPKRGGPKPLYLLRLLGVHQDQGSPAARLAALKRHFIQGSESYDNIELPVDATTCTAVG
jgi:hypothetical protein